MTLRLVATPSEPALTQASRGARPVTRRPGERYEPVALSQGQLAALRQLSTTCKVPSGTLLAVLLETSEALEWARQLGYEPETILTAEATSGQRRIALSGAQARYLSWLSLERGYRHVPAFDEPITLPVRLIQGASSEAIDSALRCSAEAALALEAQAVSRGLTVREMVARVMAESVAALGTTTQSVTIEPVENGARLTR